MIEPGNQDTFSDVIRTATECLNYGMIFVGEQRERPRSVTGKEVRPLMILSEIHLQWKR